jgi:hypothetical protein
VKAGCKRRVDEFDDLYEGHLQDVLLDAEIILTRVMWASVPAWSTRLLISDVKAKPLAR